jgi:hypothetical protein
MVSLSGHRAKHPAAMCSPNDEEAIGETVSRLALPLPLGADRRSGLFEAAFDILAPKGMFQTFLARVDGQHVGAIMLLPHKHRGIAWYGGSDRDFSSYCAWRA